MTALQFTVQVPEEITSNKEWFQYLSESFHDLYMAYKEGAEISQDEIPETHPLYATILDEARGITSSRSISCEDQFKNPDIPLLLKCVPYPSIDPTEGIGDVIIITMENMRQAIENCLQDHSYAHTVCIEGNNFIIEPMLDNTFPVQVEE